MFIFVFCSNLEKFSLSLITSKNEMEKCDMSKRNGEVRYVKTKWRNAICQNEMEKFDMSKRNGEVRISNRFRSNRSEETSQTNG